MSIVAEKYPQKIVNLCKALKKGPLPVSKLSDELRDDAVLSDAFSSGLITIGRQSYSMTMSSIKAAKDKEGKPVLDEQRRQVFDKEYVTRPDGEWSWMTNQSTNRKPLNEVLEEKLPAGIEIHARLTNSGLAATV